MFHHISVLRDELVHCIAATETDVVIDATLGGGGHASAVSSMIPKGLLIGIDRDQSALDHCREKFAREIEDGRIRLQHGRFSGLAAAATTHAPGRPVNIIYADLGVSSPQLDDAGRGFSMQLTADLDMRMDQRTPGRTAREIVNEYSEQELTRIFREFAEEPKAAYYARKIAAQRQQRPFETTTQLAQFIQETNPYREPSRRHPATRIFQALRIEVNQELEEVTRFLMESFTTLAPGGRLAVITFHSLEDRLVKDFFKAAAAREKSDGAWARLPVREVDLAEPMAAIRKPFPMMPTDRETTENPRARSAKLRVLTKIRNGVPAWKH